MFTRRLAVAACFALVGLAACQSTGRNLNPPIPAVPPHIAAALNAPDRTDAMKARDAGRRPGELFALAGLKVGDRVIELGSFGRYDSTIIVNAIGPTGHLYMYDLPYQQQRQEAPTREFNTRHPNSEYVIGKFDDLTFPSNIDMVVLDMYYHDLTIPGTGDVDVAVLNRKLFNALKPGGRVLIVDHNAEPGSGRRDIATVHRIDPAVIKADMAAAGFRLIVDSSIFRNPMDALTKRVFEPTTRGSTDRSVLIYEKPR